jgi:integrase
MRDGPRTRKQNGGLRKRCDCPRRNWAKCRHDWHVNFAAGGKHYRYSLAVVARDRGEPAPATKTDAARWRDRLRTEVDDGGFRRPTPPTPATADALTFDQYRAIFVSRYSQGLKQKTSWKDDEVRAAKMAAFVLPETGQRIGDMGIGAITEDHITAFLASLTARRCSASTRNHYLQLAKSMSKYGVKKGHLTRPWLAADSDLKREKPARRHRRLAEGEEAALIAAAPPRLQRVIIGALETGCRLGELLKLTWGDVDLERRQVTIRGEHAKDGETRTLPLSSRLRAVVEMTRFDPAGEKLPPTAAVFGDELGGRVTCIKKAWETCVLKAHGESVAFVPKTHRLTAECRAALKRINLHFHDLRHEAGSKFLEAGWPLHHVKEMLGHADVKTTDTYLNPTLIGLQESMRKLEEARESCTRVAQTPPAEYRAPCNEVPDRDAKLLVN